jgi:hypothetical protein
MAESIGIAERPRSLTIRLYQPGDERGIMELFHRVFGKERSLAYWRWKFQGNPEGAQVCLAVTDAGEVVGQYTGIPVRVAVDGRVVIFSQAVDSMVDARYRLGLKKPGVFASVFTRFAEEFGGRDRVLILWGYTTPEALRIGQRLLGYVALHPVMKLIGPVGDPPHSTPWQQMMDLWRGLRCPIRRVSRFDAGVDRLWERCGRELRVATVRDARYLNWRYADCPDVQYRLLVAGGAFGAPVRGIAVLRLGWMDEPVACLVDWLVPVAARSVAERMLGRCLEEARGAGMKELHAWFPRSSSWHRFLLERGFEAVEAATMTVRQFAPDVPLDLLDGHWYYTMGDSDHY